MKNIAPKTILLDKFEPRHYQLPIYRALEVQGYKRILAILPRRAGKDLTAWNLMIRQALKKIGVYWYILPSYSMAKKIIWNGIDNNGHSFLSYIPDELIDAQNSQEMIIKLTNGSIIQLVGSDTAKDSLVGTNAIGMVFSEYSIQNPDAYAYLRPILVANGGWCIILSTPRGRNSLWQLYEIAINHPKEWFVLKLTVDDTKHIPKEAIQKDIETGEMSWDLAQQEYWTSFDLGVEGAYYTKYLDDMKREDRIGDVPWDPSLPVHTAWDLGVNDLNTIIFFQLKNDNIYVIDCYTHSDVGLAHYIKKLDSFPYKYRFHYAPHDINVRDYTTGMSRIEVARSLGIEFQVAPRMSLYDGIEAVRNTLPRTYIDRKKGATLITALENYRKVYDPKINNYRDKPIHDRHSHMCDAFRYLALCYKKAAPSLSAEQYEEMYKKATNINPGGPTSSMHNWF